MLHAVSFLSGGKSCVIRTGTLSAEISDHVPLIRQSTVPLNPSEGKETMILYRRENWTDSPGLQLSGLSAGQIAFRVIPPGPLSSSGRRYWWAGGV